MIENVFNILRDNESKDFITPHKENLFKTMMMKNNFKRFYYFYGNFPNSVILTYYSYNGNSSFLLKEISKNYKYRIAKNAEIQYCISIHLKKRIYNI